MAAKEENLPNFRENVLQNLRQRNRMQCICFAGIIQAHNRMFETVDTLKSKNIHLSLDTEKLRQENLDLKVKVEAGGGGTGGGERTQALEQKLFKLQEELTELHRRKGENSQQIIDLNNAVQEKEKLLQDKTAKLSDAEIRITSLQEMIKHLENKLLEVEATNQMLKDEQQALQMAFTSLEGNFRKLTNENAELVQRWMAQKAKAADKLNEENDQMLRQRQAKLKKELADAAQTPVDIRPADNWTGGHIPLCLSVSIPSKPQYKFDAHDGEVNAVRWSPSGRLFATGGADRKLKLWEIIGGKCLVKASLAGSNAGVMSAEFDNEEHYVIGASSDFASRVWTVSDHRLRHTLTGHSGKVFAAKFFGMDCHKVVSGSHDRTLKIWDLRSKACVKTIFAGSACFDLVTSEGSNSIISGHFDKRIRFWDTRSDNSVNEISLQGRITSLDLLSDGYTLLSCSRDDTLKTIDLRMNQVMGTFCGDNFKVAADWTRAVFSPDGQYVSAGSQDGSVYIWNVTKQKVEKVLSKEHNNPIMAVSWHPSGSHILSCDRQKKAVLWADF